MAITDKKTGPWGLDQVYNKINQGSIWEYSGSSILFAAGAATQGELGLNDIVRRSSPTQIPGTWDGAITAGYYSVLATKSDGTLWTWGRNDSWSAGMLGLNNQTGYSSPVQIGSGTDWTTTDDRKLSLGDEQTFVIKPNGTLWSWGKNQYGSTGVPSIGTGERSSPVQVGSDTTWKHASAGSFGQLAIKTDGTMWSWGSNAYGVLGLNQTGSEWPSYGDAQKYSSPVQVPGTTWDKIPQSAAYSRYAIKTDGTLWAWGRNNWGLLGQNNRTSYSSPTQIPGTTWSKLWDGKAKNFFAAIKTDGTLWVMGRGSNGNLGQNESSPSAAYSSPVQVPGTTWNTVTGGSELICATKTDGTAWAWGNNTNGQLMQNNRTQYSSPVQIPGNWTNAFQGAVTTFLIGETA